MLYPLSYEGGDGAERGAKLGATARKPWGKGSSGTTAHTATVMSESKSSSLGRTSDEHHGATGEEPSSLWPLDHNVTCGQIRA